MPRITVRDSSLGTYVASTDANVWDSGAATVGSIENWNAMQKVRRYAPLARRKGVALQTTIYVAVCRTANGGGADVFRNGVWFAQLAASASIKNQVIAVPGFNVGDAVEVQWGFQGVETVLSSATRYTGMHVLGTYGMSEILPSTPARALVVISDSTIFGTNMSTGVAGRDSAAALLKTNFPGRVACIGASGYDAISYGLTGAQMADAAIALLGAAATRDIVFYTGTNEYLLNAGSLATCTTQNTTMADRINAASPGTKLWLCQLARMANDNVNNGNGWKPSDHRAMEATTQSTRSAFVNLIDLQAALTFGAPDYENDLIHWSTVGSAKVYAYIKAQMGW